MAVAVKTEAFLALENTLAERVRKKVLKRVRNKATKAASFVRAGKFSEAHDAIDTINLKGVLKKEQKFIKYMGMQAILFGARDFKSVRDTSFKSNPPIDTLERSARVFTLLLEVQAEEAIKRNAHQKISLEESAQKDGLYKSQKAVSKGFVKDFVEFADNDVTAYAQLGSSLHTSRLASWGFTVEAEITNATTYKVSEQLDGRTCPVCKIMDGKVFPLQSAKEKLEKWLSIDNPEDLKAVAKWPSRSKDAVVELSKMSNDDIVAAGWDTPPYHPLCRGVLRKSTVSQVTETPIDIATNVPADTARKYLDNLQTYDKSGAVAEKGAYIRSPMKKASNNIVSSIRDTEASTMTNLMSEAVEETVDLDMIRASDGMVKKSSLVNYLKTLADHVDTRTPVVFEVGGVYVAMSHDQLILTAKKLLGDSTALATVVHIPTN